MPPTTLYCQSCGRDYRVRDPVDGRRVFCAACGGPLGDEAPEASPSGPDPWRGRSVGGARLRKRLAVRPTRLLYRARHRKLGADVRVELFTAQLAERQRDYMEEVFRRAALARDLRSPYVAAVVDLGRRGECWFIITEWHPSTLRELIEREPRLDVNRALVLAEHLLRGLGALDERGVRHGDVRPETMLIGYDGAGKLDHPGAMGLPEERGRLLLTPGGRVRGVPFYAAPQAAGGEGDASAGLYAAGAVMFEMLAGRPAHAGASAEEVRRAAAQGPPELRAARPEVPSEIADCVARLLAPDPADRPEGPQEALEELRACALSLSRERRIKPIAASFSPGERTRCAVRWTLAWTIVAALLVAVAVPPVALMWRQRAERRAAVQQAEAEQRRRVLIVLHQADPLRPDPLPPQRRRAVRALLTYALATHPELEPADPHYALAARAEGGEAEALLERAGAAHMLAAAHAPGFRRRTWQLTFVTPGKRPWALAAECAVEGDDLSPLSDAAGGLLARAAGHIGLPAAGEEPAALEAEADAWATLGAAWEAERDGHWAEAAAHARTAAGLADDGAPFAVFAAFYGAVAEVRREGRFPSVGMLPAEGLPPELAGLAQVLGALGGPAHEAEARLARHLARHPYSARGYYLLGLYRLHAQGRPDEAAVAFRHAFELDPGYVPAAHGHAELLAERHPDRLGAFLALMREAMPDQERARRLAEAVAKRTEQIR